MREISELREKTDSKAFDVYNRMLSNRTLFLTGEVNDDKANLLIAQIFYLESENSSKDIQLIINSPGGWVTAGMALFDVMNYVKCDVRTICVGQAASMGAILLASGKKGKRVALPNARIMIHQPLGGMQGVVSDIEIHAREIMRIKERINEILADATGKPLDVISRDTDRDFFLSAEEAREYGLVDVVASNNSRE